jgi:hypothetical protein
MRMHLHGGECQLDVNLVANVPLVLSCFLTILSKSSSSSKPIAKQDFALFCEGNLDRETRSEIKIAVYNKLLVPQTTRHRIRGRRP